ncbi:hypothetical protein FKP32DRAFT_1538620, partial [Trametes sanguinea]
RMEESRRQRLSAAGLDNPSFRVHEEHVRPEDTEARVEQTRVNPRRSVAFETTNSRSGLQHSPSPTSEGYESASRAPAYRRPSMYDMSIRRGVSSGPDIAPSTMSRGFIRQNRPGAHNELAYVGPVASIRDSMGVQRILDMIQELMGDPPTSEPPSYLKVAKLPPPKTYEGKDDPDQFEVWLRGLLEYFSTLRLTGLDWDRDRLRLISQSLGGEAATWFYNTVQSPSRDKRDWLFEEAIVGLYRRFVHRDTHLQAEQQFANLRFDAQRGGVAALYERMLYLSDKMWERPSDFVMRKKFLEALPDQYEQILTVYKGMSAQFNTLLELYQAASELEQ